jgi:type I restriction enzyme S subunit
MVPLRDLICLADSGTWGDEAPQGAGFPVLRSSNIQEGRLDLSEVAWRLIPKADIARRLLQSGDLLMTKSSGSPNLIGKCCQFTQAEGGTNFYFSNFTLRLRADRNRADSRWLFFWLSSPRGRAVLAAFNTTTSGLRNLNIGLYLSQLVPAPPVTEQRRIAAILDKADAIRRKRQQALQLTEDLLQTVFLETVGPNHPGNEMWPLPRIADLASKRQGAIRSGPFGSDLRHSEFVDEGVAVLGIDNAVSNRFEWAQLRFITAEKFTKLQRYRVCPGDVIVTIMGTTGRSAVVPNNIPVAISTKHLATITPNLDLVDAEFLSNAIHRHPTILHQLRGANRGAIMPGLNLGLLKALKLPLPPLKDQVVFSNALTSIRALQSNLAHQSELSGDLIASLVQRAFRGEL